MQIKYDVSIEVTKTQYLYCIVQFSGAIAHREFDNKFYIKVWDLTYAKQIKKYLDGNNVI